MRPYIHAHNFQWALDCSVGKGGQNSIRADVQYIQWYYKLAAANPETTPERRQIYQLVETTGTCTGLDSDPLVRAITAHQQAIGHPIVDGKVSAVPGGEAGNLKVSGNYTFFVFRIGARLARMFPDQWPRLDLIKPCPSDVLEAAVKAVPKY
jgi:hypothetical protein